MILVDANLLIYPHVASTPHRKAHRLDDQLNGRAQLALPWPSLLAFVRLVSAHLAALAIEDGLTLCSPDGDFARFSWLRWENPLAT